MPRSYFKNDWRDRRMRSALTGLAIVLMLGLAVGVALGVVFARVFEAAQIDDIARQYSEPGAAAPVAPGTR